MSKILKGLTEANSVYGHSDPDREYGASAPTYRKRGPYSHTDDDDDGNPFAEYERQQRMFAVGRAQKAAKEKAQRDADHDRLASGTNEEQLDEISNEKLAQYKTAAALDAGKADKEGDYKRGDKRFSGIVKATKKQFANDMKPKDATVKESGNQKEFILYVNGKPAAKYLDQMQAEKDMAAVRRKHPQVNLELKHEVCDLQTIRKVNEGESILGESLGDELTSKSIQALQQVKQQLEQQRMAELAQWEKDFKQNTVAKFTARQPSFMQPKATPVAQPNEKHSVLKARLVQLSKAIEKQAILDKMLQRLDNKGLLTPAIQSDTDTSMLARDGAKDNYVSLNQKLDKALEFVKNRLMTNKAAFAKPKAIDEAQEIKFVLVVDGVPKFKFPTREEALKVLNDYKAQFPKANAKIEPRAIAKTMYEEDQLDELSCWSGYHRVAGTKAGFPGSCAKNKTNEDHSEKCPHCGGELVSEELVNEKKDACYYKVKSRYKVWPSAYASGALVKCRKKGASNWGNSTKNESSILEGLEQVDENLHQWFKEKWVRFGPDGKIRGDCARGDDSEGKPKCLPQSKAHSLGKKGRASAAARKRREDPNPERSGKAINVNTKKKTNEEALDEKWSQKYKNSINCSNPKGFSQKAHCAGKKK